MTIELQPRRLTDSSIHLAPLMLAAALATSLVLGAVATAVIGSADLSLTTGPAAAPALHYDSSRDAGRHRR
jgi:hypothetical protein